MSTVPHPQASAAFLADEKRARWHDQALWHVREKRDLAIRSVPEWESLRHHASEIKLHTLSQLGQYLTQFEQNAKASGAAVHWANDGGELRQIVQGILAKHQARSVVKSKSMLTEECGLNPELERLGIEVTDTDLGEWIVQLRHESPSHIVLPAIHVRKEEVSALFTEKIGTPKGSDDANVLTRAACEKLRETYHTAEVAISGANFLIADSGAVAICTNEGNADLGITLAPVHIVCVGVEKLIPRTEDLGVFVRLLARSATGQPITTYTSYIRGPQPGHEMHIVLVDNGRTSQLADPELRSALSCIRCGACMNTCPVYRRSGGASYGWTIPGPIGSVLAPQRFPDRFASLPFASSLCGSCTAVCPVKIPLHEQLLTLRARLTEAGHVPRSKQLALQVGASVLQSKRWYPILSRLGRLALRLTPNRMRNIRLNPWTRYRELPPVPKESFHEWYRRTK